ncbi:hypothetical protein [Crossiella sp. NPDC003009]
MSEIIEPAPRRPLSRVLGQLATAGFFGTVIMPFGLISVLGALFGGGLPALGMTVAAALAGFAILYGAAALAPGESWLGGSRVGRCCWAVLVGGFGGLGWWLGWAVTNELGLAVSRPPLGLLAGAVPFVLVAGLLLRGWYLAVGSLAVTVALGGWLLAGLAALPPDPAEVSRRLAATSVDRTQLFATELPGYRIRRDSAGWRLAPPGEPRGAKDVEVTAVPPGTATEACAASLECAEDAPGLRYQRTAGQHGYVHQRERLAVRVLGSLGVDRKLLREAALAARPATDAELLDILPPDRRHQPSPLDRLRQFARSFAG